ncbi:MAG: lysylphosphatidylglycerol synthase transmembrane domain-containing protein [Pseudomonadales bacterium]
MAVGAGLLYLTVKDLRWGEVSAQLSTLAYGWVLLALALYWVELSVRIVRWGTLLAPLRNSLSLSAVATAFVSGYAANNVLPAKLGEPFRADLFGRLAGASRMRAFGSVIVERMFDLVMVLGMTIWGVLVVSSDHLDTLADINRGLAALLVLFLLLAGGLYFVVGRKNNYLVVRVRSMSVKARNLFDGLEVPSSSRGYVNLTLLTLLIWTLNSLAMWSILMALDVQLTINQTVMLIGLTGISASIPAAPAGIGTLQYAFYLAAILYDFPTSAALLASALVQIVLLGSATLVGALAYSNAVSRHLLPRAPVEQR